ncbi:serine/threonine protein kinase [Bacillus sp. OTU530]|uniref:serine/threonine protein kinase n=1 Tax=Bacillus sp. OTU530 TaxID=3043862 RepID=UPI00313BCED1
MEQLNKFVERIETTLLKGVRLESENPYDPVVVKHTPTGWSCIGAGNYAAVFAYQGNEEWVVKIYAREQEGLKKEAKVYRKLGGHPAYSELIYQGEQYLVLKRLRGITLYEAVHKGIQIHESTIHDVNEALQYARERGLTPCDIHGKNVMMNEGKGYVVDISDFYKPGEDEKWNDLVKAYYKFYKPFFYKYSIPIPDFVLDAIRHSYRFYRKWRKKRKQVQLYKG